jgi:hypothetical protein
MTGRAKVIDLLERMPRAESINREAQWLASPSAPDPTPLGDEFEEFCRRAVDLGDSARKFAERFNERLARVRPRLSLPIQQPVDRVLEASEGLSKVHDDDEVEIDRCRTRLLFALEEACASSSGSQKHILSLLHDALAWSTGAVDTRKFHGVLRGALSAESDYPKVRLDLLESGFRVSPPAG